MIHPGPVSPSVCVFIPRTFFFPPKISSCRLPRGLPVRGAADSHYSRTVGPGRLQMSSRRVVTWHLEQIPGGVRFELIDYTPATKCCYISEMQESTKSHGGRRGGRDKERRMEENQSSTSVRAGNEG